MGVLDPAEQDPPSWRVFYFPTLEQAILHRDRFVVLVMLVLEEMTRHQIIDAIQHVALALIAAFSS
ncbi:hypothetical protein ACX4M5_01995 [Roseomonas mucosa]|nr:hypothetical protein [Roseomonas mucosa]